MGIVNSDRMVIAIAMLPVKDKVIVNAIEASSAISTLISFFNYNGDCKINCNAIVLPIAFYIVKITVTCDTSTNFNFSLKCTSF